MSGLTTNDILFYLWNLERQKYPRFPEWLDKFDADKKNYVKKIAKLKL